MLSLDQLIHEQLTIPGPAGGLSAELIYPVEGRACAAIVLVNPHPLMGGTMQNNVIAALAENLPVEGLVTLRFDYRGVGHSEGDRADVEAAMAAFWKSGHAPQDEGLIDDAQAVLRWADRHLELPVAVVGYSFGAYAALRMITDRERGATVLISPTLKQHCFQCVTTTEAPLLVIYSDDDFATPRQSTESWLASLPVPVQSLCIPGGEHFFKGLEARVTGAVGAFIRSTMRRRRF